jgi:thiosulfate/3-mercaptopyruvate sulfurtransferase
MKVMTLATLLAASASPMVLAAQAPQARSTSAAASAEIVDTAYVADAIKRGAIVWDTRAADAYQKGHIPGAVNIGDAGKALRHDYDEDYIPLAQMEKILGDAGIDPGKEVVVYGGRGDPFVYFGLVTMKYLGGKNAHIYHGGIDDWKAAGNAVSTEPTKLAPVALSAKVDPAVTVSTSDMLRTVKAHPKNVQIVDVRTPKEYSGEDIRAIRGGHIPGAVNIPYEQNWVDPTTPAKLAKKEVKSNDGMALKPRDQLKSLYAKLDPNKETVVYCQSGVRASETATVLKDLGFKNVKVYDSSWLGYGNRLDAPAQDVSYFNVGQLNGRLAAMQQRIDALEKELAAAKK